MLPIFELQRPTLVLWVNEITGSDAGWFRLEGHTCGGFSVNQVDGYVFPLNPIDSENFVSRIADEEFCSDCEYTSLDYGVTPQHQQAYQEYLSSRGLDAGWIGFLKQAFYPLALSDKNFDAFGISGIQIPTDADLIILGSNCD